MISPRLTAQRHGFWYEWDVPRTAALRLCVQCSAGTRVANRNTATLVSTYNAQLTIRNANGDPDPSAYSTAKSSDVIGRYSSCGNGGGQNGRVSSARQFAKVWTRRLSRTSGMSSCVKSFGRIAPAAISATHHINDDHARDRHCTDANISGARLSRCRAHG